MPGVSGLVTVKVRLRSMFFTPRCANWTVRCLLIGLGFTWVWTVLITPSAGQDTPHREFSARVLVQEKGAASGYGAHVYVKQDDLYLDLPDLAGQRRVPYWFLRDGTMATVKDALVHEPDLEMPLVFMLHFRSTHGDRFCQEFRAYYVGFEKFRDDLSDEEVQKLKHPESFACEPQGHQMVAERRCRSYRFTGLEDPANICFDPALATILQMNSVGGPSDLWIRLEKIEEKPQPQSLFIPPPDHIVVFKYANWGQPARAND